MDKKITVIKMNPERQETWRYEGRVIKKADSFIIIEAFFNRPDLLFHGILLAENDRFIETYDSQLWYNIFEVHDKHTDAIKGWYCNITRPAEFTDNQITYIDLALDLLVYPDGRQLILDEDEFEALKINPREREQARAALKELTLLFKSRFRAMPHTRSQDH